MLMDYATSQVEEECSTFSGFSQLPMDSLLNAQEINTFKSTIAKKRNLYNVFNNGLAKKVRLEASYRHVMIDASKQGRCVFCSLQKKPAGQNARAKLVACFYAVRQGMMHVYLALKNGILDKTLQNNNVVFLQQ